MAKKEREKDTITTITTSRRNEVLCTGCGWIKYPNTKTEISQNFVICLLQVKVFRF